jgi:hypothetical protein
MMCEQVNQFILERLGEEVPADVKLHLDACPACKAKYAQQLDVKELFSLRAYEEPKSSRVESTVALVMRAVRLHEERYETRQNQLLWLFAEPRYGVALLLLIFTGLNLARPDYNARYQAPLDDDFGTGIMLLSETSVAALSNRVYFSEFAEEVAPGVAVLKSVDAATDGFDKKGVTNGLMRVDP